LRKRYPWEPPVSQFSWGGKAVASVQDGVRGTRTHSSSSPSPPPDISWGIGWTDSASGPPTVLSASCSAASTPTVNVCAVPRRKPLDEGKQANFGDPRLQNPGQVRSRSRCPMGR
jgi:hypothetical protein